MKPIFLRLCGFKILKWLILTKPKQEDLLWKPTLKFRKERSFLLLALDFQSSFKRFWDLPIAWKMAVCTLVRRYLLTLIENALKGYEFTAS